MIIRRLFDHDGDYGLAHRLTSSVVKNSRNKNGFC